MRWPLFAFVPLCFPELLKYVPVVKLVLKLFSFLQAIQKLDYFYNTQVDLLSSSGNGMKCK